MSVEELAFRLHVSAATVTRWRAGKVAPHRSLGEAMALLFEVESAEFYVDLPEAA